jgi:hypothetical protein
MRRVSVLQAKNHMIEGQTTCCTANVMLYYISTIFDNGETFRVLNMRSHSRAGDEVGRNGWRRVSGQLNIQTQAFFYFEHIDEVTSHTLHLVPLPGSRIIAQSSLTQKTSYTSPLPSLPCLVLPINAGHRPARGKIGTVIVAVSEDLVLPPYPCLRLLPQVVGMILVDMDIIKGMIGGMNEEMIGG